MVTPLKTNECPLKWDCFNRKYIFQPLIFRGHVSFPGSILIQGSKGQIAEMCILEDIMVILYK